MTNDKRKEIPTWLRVMVVFSITVAALLIWFYFRVFTGDLSKDQGVWGQFGDYVGGILNPLFSLTALFALLHTIQLQSKELHESTEHLKESAKALTMQNEVMMRQQFEHTFFQMLGLFNEVIKGWEHDGVKGRYCLAKAIIGISSVARHTEDINRINFTYRYHAYEKHGNLLGQYFRTLYSIIKLIEDSKLENGKFYSNIVRAQLSNDELVLLFYNCLCLEGSEREKFLPLVQKYDLLEYLQPEQLANPAHRNLLPF